MLTSNLVRVRQHKDRIKPWYLDPAEPAWQQWAQTLLELFRNTVGRTRAELEDDIEETFGGLPNPQVHRGLAKLLEDRCEFETVSSQAPEELREAVFRLASEQRQSGQGFNRDGILRQVAGNLTTTAGNIEQGLFADLKSAQHIVDFQDTTAQRLLERYNVALAQGVLFKAVRVEAVVRGETPARFRQLFRKVKFHRLMCEARSAGPNSYRLALDGPLSLFSATQKYGLQLAMFLPALLLCRDFELSAELRWGPQRQPKTMILSAEDGLVSHQTDAGAYVPPELTMFAELFRKKIADWDLQDEPDVVQLADGFWVPDFRLVHQASGRDLLLEVLGFWRRASVIGHLQRLRAQVKTPFLLAVSEQLHVEDETLAELPAEVIRFRQMPVPDEIVAAAQMLLEGKT